MGEWVLHVLGAIGLAVFLAVVTFATATENVSLIGGGGILASSIGLFVYLSKIWARENTRQRHLTESESDRADRAEYRLGIAGDLLDINGIQRPANYWQWPPTKVTAP